MLMTPRGIDDRGILFGIRKGRKRTVGNSTQHLAKTGLNLKIVMSCRVQALHHTRAILQQQKSLHVQSQD